MNAFKRLGFGLAVWLSSIAAIPAAVESRLPWATSRLSGSPEPPPPYTLEQVFSNLTFKEPVEMVRAPGSERLFVMEVKGKIFSFLPGAGERDLFIDLAAGRSGFTHAYGMVFHPGFQTNRFVYLCYVLKAKDPEGSRVSRFKVTPTEPPRIDPASEQILITWLAGGHNGGSLHFGPDGYLYISAGDGEVPSPPDPLDAGQDVSNLLSSIFRIDVDQAEGGRPYRIPPDNPFVNMPGARPEIWAYGFRNPWKMSFDPVTGALWAGDVGWELWEMIYRVERGGNYGWSIKEASQPVKPFGKRGPTPIRPPIAAHTHVEARSITGGYVYRGDRLPELRGTYIYGDWVTGKIWGFPAASTAPVTPREIANSPLQIICFGLDHAGELYVVGYGGTIHRLIPNPVIPSTNPFSQRLSETGLFASVKDQAPAPGVIRYRINTEPWMDHATGERFIALPELTQLDIERRDDRQMGLVRGAWKYPRDAVLVKTVSLEMESGNPASRRRIETQVLLFDRPRDLRLGTSWNAYNYIWNDEQTDAVLAGPASSERTFEIKDDQAPGGSRQQKWHFASRTECMLCHMPRAGYVLGFNAVQLDRLQDFGGAATNQLGALEQIGLFLQPVKRPELPAPSDPAIAALENRARAYLQVNCAHCHQFGGGGTATIDLRQEIALAKTGLLDTRPSQGEFGLNDARIVAAGDPFRSVLLYRIAKLGPGRMPHTASSEVDVGGVRMLKEWIQNLPVTSGPAGQAKASAPPEALLLARIEHVDQLLASTSGALALALALGEAEPSVPAGAWQAIVDRATVHPSAAVRDLFERFLPPDRRLQKLGASIQPSAILALQGDAQRGQRIFFAEDGAQCASCHRVGGEGRDLGPDLTQIGRRLDRAAILTNLIEPSRDIAPEWIAHLVETRDGSIYTGFVIARNADELVLKDPTGIEHRLPTAQIKRTNPQQLSLMPEGLLAHLTAQNAADLLEFLASLK